MAAAVVVANPLTPPVRDLQISTTQLSTSPESLIPFDKNVLKSIPAQTGGSNVGAALAQILGALAAEADRINSEVNSEAGAFSAASPATAALGYPAHGPAGGETQPEVVPNGTPTTAGILSPAMLAASTPIFQQVVSEITAETALLGNQVVQAAYAAADAVAGAPFLAFQAFQAFLGGDLHTALQTLYKIVRSFFESGIILVGGLGDILPDFTQTPPLSPPTPAAADTAGDTGITSPIGTGVDATGTSEDNPTAKQGNGKPQDPRQPSNSRRARPGVDPTPQVPVADAAPRADAAAGGQSGAKDSNPVEQPSDRHAGQPKRTAGAGPDRGQRAAGRGSSATR